jgi:hypothetical protein
MPGKAYAKNLRRADMVAFPNAPNASLWSRYNPLFVRTSFTDIVEKDVHTAKDIEAAG